METLAVAVGTSTEELFSGTTQNLKYLRIDNLDGSNAIHIDFTNDAVATTAMLIAAGGNLTISNPTGEIDLSGSIQAIAITAEVDVVVTFDRG